MKTALARRNRKPSAGSSAEPPVIALLGDGDVAGEGDVTGGADDRGVATDAPPVHRRRRLPASVRAGAPAWTWLGIAVAAAGFVLIAIGWGQVAAEIEVYRQLPYIVSAGLVGLGLVLVGLAVLNISSRQRDAIERDRQIDELVRVIDELKQVLSAKEPR